MRSYNSKWSGRQDLNLQPLGPKPSALPSWATSRFNGVPKRSRTPNLLIRSQTLYPVELWGQLVLIIYIKAQLSNKNGGFSWNRTNDTKIFSLVLCQLSYEATMAVPTGIEPAIPRVTGECDNRYTTEPFGCGRRIWTNDLWVMSPTSYQTALSRDIILNWRRKRDSNPCASFPTSWFSRPVPSTRLGYSSIKIIGAPGRTWTGTVFNNRGILSPLRLPISPPRQIHNFY